MKTTPSREVRLTIPDKVPFEGKATQKQKQKIWELGLRDEALIASLGKQQASYVISSLLSDRKGASGGPLALIGLVFTAIGAAMFLFFSGPKATPVSAFIGICGLGCGVLILLTGLVRLMSPRLK